MRFEVAPDADGIISLRHGLNAGSVQVTCLRRGQDGQEEQVGYLFHSAITADDVEVATVPGSGVVAVVVETLDDGTRDQSKSDST